MAGSFNLTYHGRINLDSAMLAKGERMIFEPLILENAMSGFLADYALSQALTKESEFSPASVSTGDTDYRRARVLFTFPGLREAFEGELAGILRQHGLVVPGATYETQFTASGDGDFFKLHNDDGSPDAATRIITYVWYFYREPKPYQGGELRLYEMVERDNHWHMTGAYNDIVTSNNLLVIFPSYFMHEVLPVVEPARQFSNSRFTLNGWVRRPMTG